MIDMINNKKCLITQDLVSAVEWCKKAPSTLIKGTEQTWQQKAFEDLVNKLKRKYTDMPIMAQQGIDFERRLYDIGNRLQNFKDLKASDQFKEVLNNIKNGKFQTKKGREEKIEDYLCYLYAKFDVEFSDRIKDIKTTSNFSRSKYEKSFQHELYCYIKYVNFFQYIVVEWLDYPKIREVHYIDINIDLTTLKEKLHKRILDTLHFIQDAELWHTYRCEYCLY